MVDMLKKNPAVAAEVVLGRLTQKIQEWQADKRKMTDVWQKMYDANFHKSLDHRSFYFKQVSSSVCLQLCHHRVARMPCCIVQLLRLQLCTAEGSAEMTLPFWCYFIYRSFHFPAMLNKEFTAINL